MTHLNEWQPLSIRYGRGDWEDERWADKRPWGMRHRSIRVNANAQPHHWCRCAGQWGDAPCALKATQEDGRCDECRHWCDIAVDANYDPKATLR